MKITAKQSFVHGPKHYRRGDVLDVSDATGNALIKAGLADAGEQKKPAPAAKKAAKKAVTNKSGSAEGESAPKPADTENATGGTDEGTGGTGVPAAEADQGTTKD